MTLGKLDIERVAVDIGSCVDPSTRTALIDRERRSGTSPERGEVVYNSTLPTARLDRQTGRPVDRQNGANVL
jgi:hypothetical protein